MFIERGGEEGRKRRGKEKERTYLELILSVDQRATNERQEEERGVGRVGKGRERGDACPLQYILPSITLVHHELDHMHMITISPLHHMFVLRREREKYCYEETIKKSILCQ